MSYMENVQKPQEKLQISWFSGYWGGIWGAFFHDFSMWDVLWWILGCTLAALGPYNDPGRGSGTPLDAEREPMSSSSDPLGKAGRSGFGVRKICFSNIIYVYRYI